MVRREHRAAAVGAEKPERHPLKRLCFQVNFHVPFDLTYTTNRQHYDCIQFRDGHLQSK